jgi:acetyl-CoA carboxylase biotin carboxyl carrier protein
VTHPQDSDHNEQQPEDGSAPNPAPDDWFSQDDTLRALAQLVRDEKLVELEVSRGTARVVLKTAQAVENGRTNFGPMAFPAVEAAGLSSGEEALDAREESATQDTPAEAPAEDANLITVMSPMVGIFYRAPSPNDPNFVEVGARVEVGQTLGLVETMKVFNEITSEWEGTVVEIVAENSQLLETGDRLLVLRKS